MPTNMQSSLIFHYNLKFYDSEGDTYDGVSLKRFVMQVNSILHLFVVDTFLSQLVSLIWWDFPQLNWSGLRYNIKYNWDFKSGVTWQFSCSNITY